MAKSKQQKQQEAAERAAARAARTDAEQIDFLERQGKQGCKEWQRLMSKLGMNVNDR